MSRLQFERNLLMDNARRERNRKRRVHYRRKTQHTQRLCTLNQQQLTMRSYCPGVIAFALLYGERSLR